MQAKHIYFLHAQENQDTAALLRAELQSSFLVWHENGAAEQMEQQLAAQRFGKEQAVALVLISDNFLKSADCMKRLLVFTQEESLPLLMPVLIDGKQISEDGRVLPVPTEISAIQNIIYYRDFWYDEWIRLRKQGNFATEDELREIEAQKNFSKKMQPMMNTILRHINNSLPLSLEQLRADSYEALFARLGLAELSVAERSLSLRQAIAVEEAAAEEEMQPFVDNTPLNDPLPPVEDIEIFTEEPLQIQLPQEQEAPFAIDFSSEEQGDSSSESTEEAPQEQAPAQSLISAVFEQTLADEDTVTETSQDDLKAHLLKADSSDETSAQEQNTAPSAEINSIIDNDGTEFHLAAETNIFFALPDSTPPAKAEENTADDNSAAASEAPALVFENFVIAETDDIDVLFTLAETETEESDFANARLCYERVLAIDPANGRAHLALARLFAHLMHLPAEAAIAYRNALLCNDENARICYEYALFTLPNHPRRAVELLQQALQIQPLFAEAYVALAEAYQAVGQTDAARAAYLQACLLNAELRNPALDSQLAILRPAEPEPVAEEAAPAEEAIEEEAPVAEEAAPASVEEAPAPNPNADTVVLITGATAGIGKAAAERFIRDGYSVVISGRRGERLQALKESFDEDTQSRIQCLCADVRDSAAFSQAFRALSEKFQQVDLLINNAGLAKGSSPIHEGEWSHWETMIDTNIKGLLLSTRTVAAQMVARRKGHIINIGSAAAKDAYANGNVYCATKAAVDMLTKAMRLDLYKHGIRVSTINPGMTETEFALVRYEDPARAEQLYADFQPLSAEDVADAIYFVASRPAHVNIQDVLLYSTQQAATAVVDRSGRADRQPAAEADAPAEAIAHIQ